MIGLNLGGVRRITSYAWKISDKSIPCDVESVHTAAFYYVKLYLIVIHQILAV